VFNLALTGDILGSNRCSGYHSRVGYEAVNIGQYRYRRFADLTASMFNLSKKSRPRQEVLIYLNSLHGVILQDAVSLMKLVVTHRHTVLQQTEET